MNPYVYPIVLVALQSICIGHLRSRLETYNGRSSSFWNTVFWKTSSISKKFGFGFLISLAIIKTSVPWYAPVIIGPAGFLAGLLVYLPLDVLIFSRYVIADFTAKQLAVLGAIAVGVAEVAWLLSFCEIGTIG